MEGLSIKTQESIYLNVIPNDQEALLIDSIDSTNQLRIVEPVGLLLPLHIGATRRVILANMELEQQERYIKETNLELRTPKTIVKESDLRAELIKIKEQGYAISFEETTLGTAGIAVALFGIDGVEGSLGIATPHIRLTEDVIPIYAKLLTEAADKISNALCGR
jgi:IclR family KDG regulon transcriptional repressor